MEQILQLIQNYPLIVAAASWAAAQVMKAIINALQTKHVRRYGCPPGSRGTGQSIEPFGQKQAAG